MSSTQFSYSSARLRRVKYLQFGVFSPEEVRAMSVTKQTKVNDRIVPDGITRPETYLNGHPVIGGIGDPRMGTCDFRARCKTCDCRPLPPYINAYMDGSDANRRL